MRFATEDIRDYHCGDAKSKSVHCTALCYYELEQALLSKSEKIRARVVEEYREQGDRIFNIEQKLEIIAENSTSSIPMDPS